MENDNLMIALECSALYKEIAEINEKLADLRKRCTHSSTYIGMYSWAPGHMHEAKICNACGEVIENVEAQIVDNLTVSNDYEQITLPAINSEHYLDLGAQAPVHVKVLWIAGGEVCCEYLNSKPGRTEMIPIELF